MNLKALMDENFQTLFFKELLDLGETAERVRMMEDCGVRARSN